MKAEETVTIDLRGKSAFSDYMIVTTGRANRHVGAIAENVTKALKPASKAFTSRLAQLRLGADRFRRCDRARIQTQVPNSDLERLWTQIRRRRASGS
jgi:hypothetical protein